MTDNSGNHEIYFSVDIEADGPCPGMNSMLSLGCAAFAHDGTRLDTFSANLAPLPESKPHPVTESWWAAQPPEVFDACRLEPEPPGEVMRRFAEWVVETCAGALPVFVAWPVAFDFPFIDHYLRRFTGTNPFGYKALDVQSLAMGALGEARYRRIVKSRLPPNWLPACPHTHVALDDAIEQGELFMNVYRFVVQRQP